MKKYFLFLVVSIFALTFASCSKEENEEPNTPPTTTTSFEGTYNGDLTVVINGLEPIVNKYDIVVEKVADKTMNLTLKKFSITDPTSGNEVNIGDIKLSNIALTENAGVYTFTAEETLKLDVFGTGSPMDIPVKITSGKIENSKLTTSISIEVIKDVMTVNVEFAGTKK